MHNIVLLFADRVIASQSRKRGNERRGGRNEEMGRRAWFFRSGTFFTLPEHGIRRSYPSLQPHPLASCIFDSSGVATTGFCYCEPTRCNLASVRARARAYMYIRVCPRGCRLAVSWESRSARPWSRYTPLHCGSCLRSERVHLVSSTRLYIDTQVHDCESRLVALLGISCDEEQRIYKIMKLSIFLFCINILF